jgi:hypothetical protein
MEATKTCPKCGSGDDFWEFLAQQQPLDLEFTSPPRAGWTVARPGSRS